MLPKKRKSIDIKTKLAILKAVDDGRNKTEISNEFGIAKSTLSTILSQRSEIEKNDFLSPDRKRLRAAPFEELEKKLFDWLMQSRQSNIPVGGNVFQEKARKEALKLGIENFQASGGWLHRFKARYNLSTLRVCGEAAAVDPEVQGKWQEKLDAHILGYEKKNIFNCDEAGIFYNLLPDRTLEVKGRTCHGGKQSKERFTVLFCVNCDGSEKMEPLVIGKFLKPRCFKNLKHLPCKYKANKSSWMTTSLFQEWLQSFDCRMGVQNRKILLFIDHCPAHNANTSVLKNIKVIFFPPNCTSILQPLDQGVIAQVKRDYKKQLVQYLLCQMASGKDVSSLKWNILQAMHRLKLAWNRISPDTVANCFAKAGFPANTQEVDSSSKEDDEEAQEHEVAWVEVKKSFGIANISFRDFASVDNQLATCSPDTEVINLPTENIQASSDEDDSEEGSGMKCPPREDICKALDVLEKLFLTSVNLSHHMPALQNMERDVAKELREMKKQTSITYFFSKK